MESGAELPIVCFVGAPKFRRLIIRSKEEYSAFEGANTPYCRPVYLDAA